MKRLLFALSISAASCSLLVNFDPNGQPCDPTGACLPGFSCVNKVCVDGGVGASGGTGGTGGTAGGVGGTGGSGGGAACACSSTELCVNGGCLPRNCGATICANGAVCSGGNCVPTLCVGITCGTGQVCDGSGGCRSATCGATTCAGGLACVIDAGTLHCVDVACAGLNCAATTRCVNGACVACDTTPETLCNDGVDNDCDGTVDCADTDCATLLCDDGNPCTTQEKCAAGNVCAGGVAVTCAAPGPCAADAGVCTLAGGGCSYTQKPEATLCGVLPKSRCCGGACVDISTDGLNCGGCGLSCGTGNSCVSVANTVACTSHPADTTGRCTCTTAQCPGSQTCLVTSLAGSASCSPQDAGQCAFKELVSIATDNCPNFCSY